MKSPCGHLVHGLLTPPHIRAAGEVETLVRSSLPQLSTYVSSKIKAQSFILYSVYPVHTTHHASRWHQKRWFFYNHNTIIVVVAVVVV